MFPGRCLLRDEVSNEREVLSHSTLPERIAFIGDYPPRLCGIATFTQDLCEAVAVAAPSSQCYAGAVNDTIEGYRYPSRVHFEFQEKLQAQGRI